MLDGTSYQVVREIGAGGMGVVYEIEHVRLKKRYVAKVIHDQIKNDDGAAKRMEREAQVLAAISHPNIVQVHDVGTTQEGVSYFVMEKLEGVDLRSMMRHGVTRLRSIDIIIDVLDALEYVHRRGIVHRDIKPENIFLSEQPRGTVTKVLDFGIVHIFDKDGRVSQGRITKTGGFVGTLYYAAPEQMQGKPASPPNDIYAAGLVLFELLAGKGPFDDDPGVGLSRCFKPAPRLTDFVPHAPRELSEVVATALEQEPERRPSAGALATELRGVAAALRSNPHVAEDEAIRAEVHDLLRHIAPIDDAHPRPAAGRVATPASAPFGNAAGGPSTSGASSGSGTGPNATAAPATPMMAGAPGRAPSEPRVFEATLASPTGEAPAANASSPPRPAIGEPPTEGQVAAPHTPTMLGAGVVAQRPSTPEGVPVGGAAAWSPSPGAPSGSLVQAGHPVSAPPPSPRFPPGTERGMGPAQASAGYGAAPAPGLVGPSQPGQPPPLFAATLAVRSVRTESVPGAPARTGDTSPGLYATVDNQPTSTATPAMKRPPWAAIALAASGLVLALLLVGGAFALKQRSTSSASAPAPEATATATSAPAPAPTVPALSAGVGHDTKPPEPATSASTPTPATTPAVTAAAPAAPRAASPQPPARATTTALPATKPATKPTSAGPAADKDGYVRSF